MSKGTSYIPQPSATNTNVLQEIPAPTDSKHEVNLEQESPEQKTVDNNTVDGKMQQMPVDQAAGGATPELVSAASESNENNPPSKTRAASGSFSRSQGGPRRGRGWFRGRRGRGVRAVTPARHEEAKRT